MTRKEAENQATFLSSLATPDNVWLVVDTGGIFVAEYRVWRESTLNEEEHTSPETLPPYELVSRAENGQLQQIA